MSYSIRPALVFLSIALAFLLPAEGQTYPTANSLLTGVWTDSNPTPLPYRYFIPVGYQATDTARKYPLVLFLHGQNERGTDNVSQLNNNANGAMIFISSAHPNNQADYPCFWIAPQCSTEAGGWDSGNATSADQAYALVSYFMAHYNIDPDRIYITGLSAGGGGASFLLAKDPHRWAAASICSGWCDGNWSTYCQIPLWVFHCADDTTVEITGMDDFIAKARALGANPIYSRYDHGGHSAWNQGYSAATPLVPWMMAQVRGHGASPLGGPDAHAPVNVDDRAKRWAPLHDWQ